MRYLLDTNVAISILRNDPSVVRIRLREAIECGAKVSISAVAVFELWYGAARSNRPDKNSDSINQFLSSSIEIQTFDPDSAFEAGRIRARLEQQGMTIGPYDILIAAQAVASNSILVTANTKEFARVTDLQCIDWST